MSTHRCGLTAGAAGAACPACASTTKIAPRNVNILLRLSVTAVSSVKTRAEVPHFCPSIPFVGTASVRVLPFRSPHAALGARPAPLYHSAVSAMHQEQSPQADGDSSVELLARVREGDREALDRLLHRYVPALRRWATG